MTSRIAVARRSSNVVAAAVNDAKGKMRVPLGRITNNRPVRQSADRAVSRATREGRPVAHQPSPQVRLEPFHHVEVPIGDPSDPQDVTEYEHIIYRSLRQKERMMQPLKFEQAEITLSDRNALIDSLCHMHYKLSLATNALYRCIGILDRYLSIAQVPKRKLTLVGCACLLAASKIEDIYPAQSTDLITLTSRAFSQRELFAMEIQVMNAIQFDTTFATPLFYLTQFMRISGQTKETLLLARYIMEICQTHEHFYGVPPALVASLAVMVTRILKGQEKWPENLSGYTGFSEEELAPYASVVREMLLDRDREESRFMRRKYGSDLFLGVAHIHVPARFV